MKVFIFACVFIDHRFSKDSSFVKTSNISNKVLSRSIRTTGFLPISRLNKFLKFSFPGVEFSISNLRKTFSQTDSNCLIFLLMIDALTFFSPCVVLVLQR
ncbi:hypothetical protein EGI11_10830 [Chryseobacterium sp. H3056]|uniref:Uncharacterized protein n=1 Tax=Kaistella daneshvariae TaxID=2487074 RepID=A0A3N0WSQ9_9FLAO|nr:hypothetical protein EGI11_10830 [Kaistella daneshvariae]